MNGIVEIFVNNKPIRIGQVLPSKIENTEINYNQFFSLKISKSDAARLRIWLRELLTKSEFLIVNGVIQIKEEDIKWTKLN